jgi:hypothetical protein
LSHPVALSLKRGLLESGQKIVAEFGRAICYAAFTRPVRVRTLKNREVVGQCRGSKCLGFAAVVLMRIKHQSLMLSSKTKQNDARYCAPRLRIGPCRHGVIKGQGAQNSGVLHRMTGTLLASAKPNVRDRKWLATHAPKRLAQNLVEPEEFEVSCRRLSWHRAKRSFPSGQGFDESMVEQNGRARLPPSQNSWTSKAQQQLRPPDNWSFPFAMSLVANPFAACKAQLS